MNPPMIRIWRFYEAPEEYRAGFSNDDVDWLAHVPAELLLGGITWLENSTGAGGFGPCSVENMMQGDGSMVYVGYHS